MQVVPDLDSSNLKSATYNPSGRILTVEFHSGATYRYPNVPEFHYTNLLKADSPGRYFASRIRGTFDAEKLGE